MLRLVSQKHGTCKSNLRSNLRKSVEAWGDKKSGRDPNQAFLSFSHPALQPTVSRRKQGATDEGGKGGGGGGGGSRSHFTGNKTALLQFTENEIAISKF